ncbi:MAG: hypothetical protein ACRDL0_14770 [Thermoleophilaceae bacterium]
MTSANGAAVRFTEEMKGRVAFAESDFHRGRERGDRLMFHLTIETPAIDVFVDDPRHEAEATGWVHAEVLGGRLLVERGWFNLFVDTERPGEKRMLYRLHFADAVGHPLTLTGYKVIAHDAGFDLWPDTTTLFTRLLRGHVGPDAEEGAELVASGILYVQKLDFLRQLTTFRGSGSTPMRNLGALARFNVLFLDQLRQVYAPRLGGRGRG